MQADSPGTAGFIPFDPQLIKESAQPVAPTIAARLAKHRLSLGLISLATIVGQTGTLLHQFYGVDNLDTVSYVTAAQNLLYHGQPLDPLRPLGYPGFVAVFYALGLAHPLFWVMLAQVIITIVTGFEIYLLAYRVTQHQAVSAIVAALVSSNLYMLQFERDILSETLSFWSIVTVFLVFEWYVRTERREGLIALAGLSVFSVLVHPFNVYVPALILAVLAIWMFRKGRLRLAWRGLLSTFIVIYGLLVVYMAGNEVTNHFFGISDVTNINFFGKVLEYHLYDDTNDPRYAGVKADVDAYASAYPPGTKLDPFTFIYIRYPKYSADGVSLLGAYSVSILKSHLGTVIADSVPDIGYALNTPSLLYHTDVAYTFNGDVNERGHLEYTSSWRKLLLKISAAEYWIYPILPVVLIIAGILWWRMPERSDFMILFILGLMVAINIFISGIDVSDLAQFYRLRFPLDWAFFLLVIALAAEALNWSQKQGKQKTSPA
jgi:hypothetical protein